MLTESENEEKPYVWSILLFRAGDALPAIINRKDSNLMILLSFLL